MEYRRLGRAGLKLSALSFGSWVTFGNQVDLEQAKSMLALAYDHGVNFFDNAEVYAHGESERIMGRALKELNWPRDSYCVSSKAFFGAVPQPKPTQRGLSRKHLIEACHQALRRLQVEHLDLYFCHRPDDEVSLDEVVQTMDILVRQGKVLYWGTSEWGALEIQDAAEYAQKHSLIGPSMEQPQYHLLHRERVESEYAPLYRSLGLGTTTWSPLASGLLTGKYRDGHIPADSRLALPGYDWLKAPVLGGDVAARRILLDRLAAIAQGLGMSLPQLAIAWCLKNPQVSSVILGASKPEQLSHNLAAVDCVARLDGAAVNAIEGALIGL